MKANKKLVAGVLATAMAFAPLHALGQTFNTPTLNLNATGQDGIAVFEGQLDGGTWGLRVSDFTDGMNQVNLSVSINGVVQSWRAAVREGAAFMFTVPAGGADVRVLASTNHANQGSFTLNVVEQAVGTDSFTPGTFTGVATSFGFYGNAHTAVAVTVSETEILDIQVTDHDDTPNWIARANPALLDSILLAQSTDVDMVSSATTSSVGILEAVNAALEAARSGEAVEAEEVEEAELSELDVEPVPMPEVPVVGAVAGLPTATASFTPGVQTVTVPGWQDAPMTVSVTFGADQITSIDIVEHGESKYGSGWALRAFDAVPDQILVHQSTQALDVFTGATSTQTAIVSAVEEAITLAGANPTALEAQIPTAPLAGDRFIPGFVEIIVPHSTHNMAGTGAADGSDRMLFSQETDMTIRVSFARNGFHLHQGNTTNANYAQLGPNNSHGESAYAIAGLTAESTDEEINAAIGGGAWGGWFFRQVVQHQINDTQSTQGIDINTGATMTASGILFGVEQAMEAAGANPADIAPRAAVSQLERNPSAAATVPFFNPGIYTVTVDGFVGPIEVRVTLDRTHIRRLEILSHSETPNFMDMVWGAPANHSLRNAIYVAQAGGLADIDVTTGATTTATAIVSAVQQVVDAAWID